MGTSFYWKDQATRGSNGEMSFEDRLDPVVHIGKRSAAGGYCWDCGITFCTDGTRGVHTGSAHTEVCPNCGKSPKKAATDAAFMELGFRSKKLIRRGAGSASSFTWTMMKHRTALQELGRSRKKVVVDEYGKEYSAVEFLKMLEECCPIQFQMYGEWS